MTGLGFCIGGMMIKYQWLMLLLAALVMACANDQLPINKTQATPSSETKAGPTTSPSGELQLSTKDHDADILAPQPLGDLRPFDPFKDTKIKSFAFRDSESGALILGQPLSLSCLFDAKGEQSKSRQSIQHTPNAEGVYTLNTTLLDGQYLLSSDHYRLIIEHDLKELYRSIAPLIVQDGTLRPNPASKLDFQISDHLGSGGTAVFPASAGYSCLVKFLDAESGETLNHVDAGAGGRQARSEGESWFYSPLVDGYEVINRIVAGERRIVGSKPGYAMPLAPVMVKVGRGIPTPRITIRLEHQFVVKGQVLSAEGQPVANATVKAYRKNERGEWERTPFGYFNTFIENTDAEGRFVAATIHGREGAKANLPKDLRLWVVSDQEGEGMIQISDPYAPQVIKLSLWKTRAYDIQVMNRIGDKPIEGAQVRIVGKAMRSEFFPNESGPYFTGAREYSGTTDSTGRVSITANLGKNQVFVDAPGFTFSDPMRGKELTDFIADWRGVESIRIRLVPSSNLTINAPIWESGDEIYARPVFKDGEKRGGSGDFYQFPATSKQFRLPALKPGLWAIAYVTKDKEIAAAGTFEFGEGKDAVFNIATRHEGPMVDLPEAIAEQLCYGFVSPISNSSSAYYLTNNADKVFEAYLAGTLESQTIRIAGGYYSPNYWASYRYVNAEGKVQIPETWLQWGLNVYSPAVSGVIEPKSDKIADPESGWTQHNPLLDLPKSIRVDNTNELEIICPLVLLTMNTGARVGLVPLGLAVPIGGGVRVKPSASVRALHRKYIWQGETRYEIKLGGGELPEVAEDVKLVVPSRTQ